MASIWQVFGKYLANIWQVFGKYLTSIWQKFGIAANHFSIKILRRPGEAEEGGGGEEGEDEKSFPELPWILHPAVKNENL